MNAGRRSVLPDYSRGMRVTLPYGQGRVLEVCLKGFAPYSLTVHGQQLVKAHHRKAERREGTK